MSHNILAPSAAHRWTKCTKSIPETLGAIDESSEYADDGTASHTLGAWCLTTGKDAVHYPDSLIHVYEDDGVKIRRTFNADDERKSYVQVYVDSVRDRLYDGALLLVETRVQSGISSLLFGPSDGTCDAGIIMPEFKQIEAHDLKYGQGVRVEATENKQMRIYLRGLVQLARELGFPVEPDWKVRGVIHQPRLDHMSDETLTVGELDAWAADIQQLLDEVDRGAMSYWPHEDVCRWCPKKATCSALATHVSNTIAAEFPVVEDMTEWGIGKALEHVELIEQWVKAVRKTAWAMLNSGQPVPGWKLVPGRQGDRKWKKPEDVEAIMRDRYRLTRDEMYDPPSLISPTQAEKRFKKSNPRQWEDLQEHITRAPPSLTLERADSAKPAYDLSSEMAKL